MKNPSVLTLSLKLAGFTVSLALFALFLNWKGISYCDKNTGIIMTFFFLITLSGMTLIVKKYNESPDSFVKYYFIVMILRLFFSISFITGGLYFNNGDKIVYIINFLVLYLLYLGFEIYYLITNFQFGSR
jgi:hypothetical protein